MSQDVLKKGAGACPVGRVSAGEIEGAVVDQIRQMVRTPEIVIGTWRAARSQAAEMTESEVREALDRFDPLWVELFPEEQARIIQLLVERVDVRESGAEISLRLEGLSHLAQDLRGQVSGDPATGGAR